MPLWIAKRSASLAWKRVPWSMVLTVALWLVQKGRERIKDTLSQKEQEELLRLVRKSRGRPSNLLKRERTRVKNIAGKAIRG